MAISDSTKICRSCNFCLPISDFHKKGCYVDGRNTTCRFCIAKQRAAIMRTAECLLPECSNIARYRGYCEWDYVKLRKSGKLPLLVSAQIASHPDYNIYKHAKYRCQNPRDKAYARYGGRGIEFRFNSFEEFCECLGPRPSLQHSLDRYPNNNGHYEIGNVRWATMTEQNRNRRDNRVLELDGVRLTTPAWAERLGKTPTSIRGRLKAGWCVRCALTLPRLSNGAVGGCLHRPTFKRGNTKSFKGDQK